MSLLERLSAALIGRYAVEREVGHGGMAVVFLAQDLKHHRAVAIKVLRPDLSAALGAERFLHEIEIAARLTHPHILPLFDSGQAEDLLYYVAPYERESLRDRLTRERQLRLDDALMIARQVAAALAYAHGQGVIHRDIKPENILLAGGDVVVADFGIARAITAAGGESLTPTGVAVGTPAYMSPEQSAKEPGLDGRSDVYSLGCVLYEMLAGEPPYTGATAQAIMARRMSDPVPPLRSVRETVPADVERAIEKALAKVPADRFATAAQFAEALGQPVAKPRRASRAAIAWIGAGAVALVVATVLVLRGLPRETVPLDPNLIAVTPFDVRGAGLSLWSEGLVEYLSRSLDGAGEFRTVSPSVFLRGWRGRADRASARDLGARTGARLVVFGSLVEGGLDSVRARAALLDVVTGQSLAEVEVAGNTLGIDRVADALGVSLLRELGRTRPVAAVRNAPFGAAPLPALKEFLRGEQFYRRGQYDSALAHHARAVALDSGFALAYRRMWLELTWFPATGVAFESRETYAFKAAGLNRGLTLRDSLLIAADSCLLALADASELDEPPLRHRLFATLDEAARRFPGDPEVWLAVGEARVHEGQPFQPFTTPPEILQAFDRAIALDSGFAPAYEHVFQLATETGHPELPRRYARAYLALRLPDDANGLWLAARLLDPARFRPPELARLVDTIGVGLLWSVAVLQLGAWPDSAETATELLRALPMGRRGVAGDDREADTLRWPQFLAQSLLYRGRAREAYQVYRPLLSRASARPWAWFGGRLVEALALLNAIPADTVTAVIARFEAQALGPRDGWQPWAGPPNWLPWLFARGDTAALRRVIEQADRAARSATSGPDQLRTGYTRMASQGYLAILRGDSAGALRDFDELTNTMCGRRGPRDCSLEKLTLARLLAARGDDRRASEVLDRWLWTGVAWRPLVVIARLERARIAERLGDRDTAIRWYQFVVDVWRHADPELQSYVYEARQGLRRLAGEPGP